MKKKPTTKTEPKKLTLRQLIKQNNAAYEKATPEQRRVMIAKDALQQIKNGRITPTEGTYVKLWGETLDRGEPLQPVLFKDGPITCNCCAKGALFISAVRLSNRWTGDPTGIGSHEINRLVEWPDSNYREIEVAFELWTEEYPWSKKWLRKYPDKEPRLVAILRNIIRNKGTFKKGDI